jgi:hypothetical protein
MAGCCNPFDLQDDHEKKKMLKEKREEKRRKSEVVTERERRCRTTILVEGWVRSVKKDCCESGF